MILASGYLCLLFWKWSILVFTCVTDCWWYFTIIFLSCKLLVLTIKGFTFDGTLPHPLSPWASILLRIGSWCPQATTNSFTSSFKCYYPITASYVVPLSHTLATTTQSWPVNACLSQAPNNGRADRTSSPRLPTAARQMVAAHVLLRSSPLPFWDMRCL